jgi:Protein of unknown function (DUF1572)
MNAPASQALIHAFSDQFDLYRSLCDRAVEHLTFDQRRESLDPQTNSIAVVMKRVAGNLRSRWTGRTSRT